jgi:hypothetical protein
MNFQVFRVLGSTLRMKAQTYSSSRGWKDFICREEKGKAAWGHAGGPETGGPVGEVGNWVFIAFFYCLRVEMSLRGKQKFPGKKKCLLGQLSPFENDNSPSTVRPSVP